MCFNKRKMVLSIIWIIVGVALIVLESVGIIGGKFYSGLGFGLLTVGAVLTVRHIKYNSNEEYKEKMDIEMQDERNRYIRMKAWAWAGYIFILASAISTIVLYTLNMKTYGLVVSYCMCAELALYGISYMVLQRKY